MKNVMWSAFADEMEKIAAGVPFSVLGKIPALRPGAMSHPGAWAGKTVTNIGKTTGTVAARPGAMAAGATGTKTAIRPPPAAAASTKPATAPAQVQKFQSPKRKSNIGKNLLMTAGAGGVGMAAFGAGQNMGHRMTAPLNQQQR